jgi:hypothetical protein
MTKTKVVDLNEIYNFVVDNFFYSKSSTIANFYLKFSYFEIQIFLIVRTNLDEEITKMKGVDLIVDDCFILNRLRFQNPI